MSSATAPGRSRGPYAKTAQRRAEIIAAASRVFAVSGYHGGSLRQISRDLDLSFTSLLHHFPSKDELLVAVLEDADSAERDAVETDLRERGVVEAMVNLASRNLRKPEMLRLVAVLAAEASSPGHPAHQWFDERYVRLRELLTEAIREDQRQQRAMSTAEPAQLAAQLIALWDGLQLQWLIRPQTNMIDLLRTAARGLLDA
ncbi:TetR/AcrR family transcriptional regulator [Streptomyces sp. NPDC047841]|uniref:TetR/AcrR family transcriptional regulator n=1 Tax=Streptomyces sp. NPDC047841 TaxID=3154708 RepID=UPI003453FAF4